jgi:hypothetical protein
MMGVTRRGNVCYLGLTPQPCLLFGTDPAAGPRSRLIKSSGLSLIIR